MKAKNTIIALMFSILLLLSPSQSKAESLLDVDNITQQGYIDQEQMLREDDIKTINQINNHLNGPKVLVVTLSDSTGFDIDSIIDELYDSGRIPKDAAVVAIFPSKTNQGYDLSIKAGDIASQYIDEAGLSNELYSVINNEMNNEEMGKGLVRLATYLGNNLSNIPKENVVENSNEKEKDKEDVEKELDDKDKKEKNKEKEETEKAQQESFEDKDADLIAGLNKINDMYKDDNYKLAKTNTTIDKIKNHYSNRYNIFTDLFIFGMVILIIVMLKTLYMDRYPIKGSRATKKYYKHTDSGYDDVPFKNVELFFSEREAKKAGYERGIDDEEYWNV